MHTRLCTHVDENAANVRVPNAFGAADVRVDQPVLQRFVAVVEHILAAGNRAAVAQLLAELRRVGLAIESRMVLLDPRLAGRGWLRDCAIVPGLGSLALIVVQLAAQLRLVGPVLVARWGYRGVRLRGRVKLEEPPREMRIFELLAHTGEPGQRFNKVPINKKLGLRV